MILFLILDIKKKWLILFRYLAFKLIRNKVIF